ncbi:MAG: arylesterase [Candidatus Omnitrophota bacterium]|nr:MAG: arylesterase [Candidatus Omnitrophota bacterium]
MCKVIISFLILISSGCSAPIIKNLDNQGANVICFGDSIAQGAGIDKEHSYPYLLGKLIGRPVINAGAGGDTTISALERLERDVLAKDPSLVIIELGGNDFLRRVPKEVTFMNLEEIIGKIHAKGAAVVLCDISSKHVLGGYRRGFRRLAKKTGSILVPGLLVGILENPHLKFDHIHPNREGHAVIAQRIYKEIRKYFDF